MSDSGLHKCAIPACDQWIEITKLMCAPHWREVPRRLKRTVNTAWAFRLKMAIAPAAPEEYQAATERHEAAKADAVAAVLGA